MAGGTFTPGVEKVRPGAYFKFKGQTPTQIKLSDRGIVVMPIALDWGPSKEFTEITNASPDSNYDRVGYKITEDPLNLVKEALKAAMKVVVFNISSGAKATATFAPLTVTAKYPGARGNALKLTISDNVILGKDVILYLGTEVVYKAEKVVKVEDLPKSLWVDFSGTGTLVNTTGVNLSNGATTQTTNADYMAFLDALETQDFNTIAFPVSDASLKSALNSKVKYFRNSIGKMVVGVTAGNPADYEGVINVKNGVVISNGQKLTPEQTVAWVAGASAAAGATEDLTYVAYPDAIDANPRISHDDTIRALKNGEFVFSVIDGKVRVEEDINSLVTYTADRDEAYSDNRAIRTFDELQVTGATILVPNKYDNNDDGQKLAKQDLVALLMRLQKINAIKNVDTDADIEIDAAASKGKSLYANVAIQPVRTFKKYYITVKTL